MRKVSVSSQEPRTAPQSMWERLRNGGPFSDVRKVLTGESRRDYRNRINGNRGKD